MSRELDANLALVAAAVERFGGLDLVHLNAGIATGMSLGADFDLERYRRAMAINLDGVVFGVHAALPALIERGGGTIIATASLAGLTPVALDPVYATNKAAVVALVRSLAGPTASRAFSSTPCARRSPTRRSSPASSRSSKRRRSRSSRSPRWSTRSPPCSTARAPASRGSSSRAASSQPFEFRGVPGPRGD